MVLGTTQDYKDICSTQTFAEEYSDLFTPGQLSWLLKTRHKNGLSKAGAILKVSQKLYINKPIFFDWFMKQKAS